MMKKLIFCIFYQVNKLFLHQYDLKSPCPSQINLIKNAKNQFLSLKYFKNTKSAQLWTFIHKTPHIQEMEIADSAKDESLGRKMYAVSQYWTGLKNKGQLMKAEGSS